MIYYKQEWLPHLKDAIPPEAKRNQISLYTIALEGWRRGLTLKFYLSIEDDQRKEIRYSLSNENKVHHFNGSSGDFNTKEAFGICENKALTASYLETSNIPVPKGSKFNEKTEVEEIITYAKNLGYPLVVKPTDGSGGASVFANITNEQALIKAIKHIKEKQQFKEIIVQEHVFGDEVRVYVLNGKVLAAANRLPANVLGDGNQTIAQLIREKNELRKNVPHLYHRPIKMDLQVRQLIEQENYTLESILPKGKRVYLSKTSNVSTGGDPIDITNELTKNQRDIAIGASKAIPGLTHSGVDIIINKETGKTVVLEVNTRPGIGSHLFPIEGNAIDIPKAIIDLYFPETKNVKPAKEYFNLQLALDSLEDEILNEIVMTPPPVFDLNAKKYIIKSEMELMNFYSSIRKYIIAHKVHGFIRVGNNENELEIIAAQENDKKINEFRTFLEQRKNMLQIKNIQEKSYNYPIKIGFSVIAGLSTKSVLELEIKYNRLNKERQIAKKEIIRLNRRLNLMKNSRAWKITAPIRFLTSLSKKK